MGTCGLYLHPVQCGTEQGFPRILNTASVIQPLAPFHFLCAGIVFQDLSTEALGLLCNGLRFLGARDITLLWADDAEEIEQNGLGSLLLAVCVAAMVSGVPGRIIRVRFVVMSHDDDMLGRAQEEVAALNAAWAFVRSALRDKPGMCRVYMAAATE